MSAGRELTVALVFTISGCAASPPSAAPSAPKQAPHALAQSASVPPASPAFASAEGMPLVEQASFRAYFEAEQVTGTVALFDSAERKLKCSDAAKCREAFIPASTFKIPNSIIGLELQVLEDAETPLPWDGERRAIANWNQDHTLRSALRVSCVPCFQHIAREVGEARMRTWVDRLEYGNRDISGGIDSFWLNGALRISPAQQIAFLRRFEEGKLPIQPRTLEIVRDILTLDVGRDHVLRGKTGWAQAADVGREVGWFVGWVELGERRVFFATLVDGHATDVDLGPLRRRLTERLLRDQQLLPD